MYFWTDEALIHAREQNDLIWSKPELMTTGHSHSTFLWYIWCAKQLWQKIKRGKTVVTLEKPRWVQSLQKSINSWASSYNWARRAGYYWLPGSRHHGGGYPLNLNGAVCRTPLCLFYCHSKSSDPPWTSLSSSFNTRFSFPPYQAGQLVAIPSMESDLDGARSPATPPVYVFPSNISCKKNILYPSVIFPHNICRLVETKSWWNMVDPISSRQGHPSPGLLPALTPQEEAPQPRLAMSASLYSRRHVASSSSFVPNWAGHIWKTINWLKYGTWQVVLVEKLGWQRIGNNWKTTIRQ